MSDLLDQQSPTRSDPAEWVDRHGDAMYAYALRRLGRGDEAEDAVQDALLAAVSAKNRFEGRSAERTWLIGILRKNDLAARHGQGYVRLERNPTRVERGSEKLRVKPKS